MRLALLASRLARPAAVLLALTATGAAQDPESREAGPPESRPSLVKEAAVLDAGGARIVVRLVGTDEQPLTGPAEVRIEPKDTPREAWAEKGSRLVARASGGEARFAMVGAKPRLLVTVTPDDRSLREVQETVAGGRPVDRETVVTITCGPATIVTGRLVDSESRPMRRTRFAAWLPEPPALVCSPGAAREAAQRTDDSGRFQLRFDLDPGALTVKKLVVSARRRAESDSRPATLGPEPTVTASLRAGPTPGSFDAGDVAFPAARFVASGRVVSDHGVQVSSAEIVVMEQGRGGWDRASGLYDARTLSGSDGRFEVRSHETPWSNHGLIANADFWACANPTPFEVGDRDVEVRVVRAGGIEGSLAGFGKHYWSSFGDGSPVSVVVEGEGAAIAARNESIEYRPGDKHLRLAVVDSRFATRRLLPGTYSVRFIGRDSAEPLLSVDGVVVNPGEITADARLQGVDVTRFLTKHVVTVVDEAGKPLSALVAARTPGGFTQFTAGASGRATVFTRQAAVDLVVVARGFRARSLPGVAADVTVTLERAAPRILTLKLDDSIQLPPPPRFIAAQLRWLCEPGQAPAAEAVWSDPRNDFDDHWRNARFDCDRTTTIRVQNPGVYEVQLWFEEDHLDGSGGTGLDQREGRRLVTVPANEDVTVVLFPDPVDLARSLETEKK